jgi:hypothetical protein
MADTQQAIDDTRRAQVLLDKIRARPKAHRFGPLIAPQVDEMRGWVELAVMSGLGVEADVAQTMARLVVIRLARGEVNVAEAILKVREDRGN